MLYTRIRPLFQVLSTSIYIIYIISATNFALTVVTIGFSNTSYSVLESNGQLNIAVEVTSGSLQRDVVINLSVFDTSHHDNSKLLWFL